MRIEMLGAAESDELTNAPPGYIPVHVEPMVNACNGLEFCLFGVRKRDDAETIVLHGDHIDGWFDDKGRKAAFEGNKVVLPGEQRAFEMVDLVAVNCFRFMVVQYREGSNE